MKTIGYRIFSFFYWLSCLAPRRKNKVFCLFHHDETREGNVGKVVTYLEQQGKYKLVVLNKTEIHHVKGKEMLRYFFHFFVKQAYHLATSSYILQDDVFLPFAYLSLRKGVKNVQLWHGTGTIKKFGQDYNKGMLKQREQRANQTITHLIVNAEKMRNQYAKAFGVPREKTYVTGLPRTDCFFHPEEMQKKKDRFYEAFPNLKGKRIVLYAPTFRDAEKENPKCMLDISMFLEQLEEDMVLLIRLHPFVARKLKWQEGQQGRFYDVSFYSDLNGLMAVADYLITDYSSLIFEFCLQRKPMIFFAYDLEEFSNRGRSFYEPYETFVPGPVVKTMQELIVTLQRNEFDYKRIEQFRDENYDFLDGNATKRVVSLIFQ